MVQKRPFGEQELYVVSSKQPRHVEANSQLVSVLHFFPHESATLKPYASGGDEGNTVKPASCNAAETPFPGKDFEICIDGSASNSSWPSSSTSEEDIRFEVPFDTLRSPEYYLPSRTVSVIHPREDYFYFLRNSPQKLVPIGPDFQAELPEWGGHGSKDKPILEGTNEKNLVLPFQALQADSVDHSGEENKLAGVCIIPMRDTNLPASNMEIAGAGRVECSCENAGSMRCVRTHILDAREKLKMSLGEETFVRLGFCGMGEAVTDQWSEEEEDLFHEIVFSNPASSIGKDFWNKLAMEFPLRTRKELVSYYFNVFILRKRAKQNKFDPSNIDSDDDEWQEIDDTADDDYKVTDEDEDSVVESPDHQNNLCRNETFENNKQANNKNAGVATWEVYKPLGFGSRKAFNDFSAGFPDKLFDTNSNSKPGVQHLDRGFPNKMCYYDASYTSNAPGITPEVCLGRTVNGRHWTCDFASIGSEGGHDSVLGPCSGKEWDMGYLSCAKNEVDLLPTRTMIEEVFGDGAWSYKGRDGHGLS